MEPRNQKVLMRFSELVFAWVLFPYSRTTSRTLATRVGGRTKSYKYYRNRKENFLLLETSKVKIFVLISDAIRVLVALVRMILDLWAAPPRCGYWRSLGFFCSAPQDFGMLGVFYAQHGSNFHALRVES